MNVLLLSAGYGKRLQPITNTYPKCLVPIGNETLLDRWLNHLNLFNFKNIYINTHYKHNLIKKHIEKFHKNKHISLLYEKKILGTSNTVLKNINLFRGDELLVIHSDNFTDFNLKYFFNSFKKMPKYCFMSMLLFKTHKPQQSGIVDVDKYQVLQNYYQKVEAPPHNIANAAIFIFSKKLITNYKKKFSSCKDISSDVVSKLIGKIYTYKTNSFFIDIGDKNSLKLVKKKMKG